MENETNKAELDSGKAELSSGNNQDKVIAAIEAVLFVYGEPLEIKRIAKILERDTDLKIKAKESEEVVKISLKELEKRYEAEDRGLGLVFSDNRVQLATKPALLPLLEDFIKEEFKESLTPASVETLSLIAYLGPLSRAQLDYYRGVNSSFILRSLMVRGLVDRRPDPKRANVYLYRPSFDLLKYLGLSKIEDLPEYGKFRAMDNSRTEAENNGETHNT